MSRRMRDEEDEELDESFVHAEIPNTFRELRACMTCSLVKTFTQFYDTGCENCSFLQMADNRQRVAECTSAYFEGCALGCSCWFFVCVAADGRLDCAG
jgi:transcription elongation factor SPT4